MKAILQNGSKTTQENSPLPSPKIDQSLVKVLLSGICRTDVFAAQGHFNLKKNRILGHEFCGEVVESARFPQGTFVTSHAFRNCGQCTGCTRSLGCVEPQMLGLDFDGVFAQYVVLDDEMILEIPTSISLQRAAFVEPVAAALAPLKALKKLKGQKGYLLGEGRFATLMSWILEENGFSFEKGLGKKTPLGSFSWVVETDSKLINQGLDLLSTEGTLVLKSRPNGLVQFDMGTAVRKNIQLQAVHYGPFSEALTYLNNPNIPFESLFASIHPIKHFERAFDLALNESSKIFLNPWLD